MRSIKKINIKNLTYYFLNDMNFDDMINIKNFNPNVLNIDKISFKSTDNVIYNIRTLFITKKY